MRVIKETPSSLQPLDVRIGFLYQSINVIISCPWQSRARTTPQHRQCGHLAKLSITESSKTAQSCSLHFLLQSPESQAGEGKVGRLSSCWGEGSFPSSLSSGRRGSVNTLVPVQCCPFLLLCPRQGYQYACMLLTLLRSLCQLCGRGRYYSQQTFTL